MDARNSREPALAVHRYSRDALGRIYAKSETVQGTTDSYAYEYDAAGRLIDVTKNSNPIGHYEYDLNGNRVADANSDTVTTENLAGVVTSTTYDVQDRLTSIDHGPSTIGYTYTNNGELLTKTVGSNDPTTYDYDFFGNLRSVTFPNDDVIEYLVDGRNRRVGKMVNSTPVQGFLYDGQLQVVAELDGSNSLVSRFVYASKANVPDYMIKGGTTYRIISDHLGSVRLVANASNGIVRQRIDYDEFGNVLDQQEFDAAGDPVASDPVAWFQPFGFAGGLYEPSTGLVRFGARDYDPATGRWSAKDPIGFAGHDTNLYGYATSDPINRLDPDGLTWQISERTFVIATTAVLLGGAIYTLNQGKGTKGPDPNTEKLLENLRRKREELRQVFEPPPDPNRPGKQDPIVGSAATICLERFGPNGRTPNTIWLLICLAGMGFANLGGIG